MLGCHKLGVINARYKVFKLSCGDMYFTFLIMKLYVQFSVYVCYMVCPGEILINEYTKKFSLQSLPILVRGILLMSIFVRDKLLFICLGYYYAFSLASI